MVDPSAKKKLYFATCVIAQVLCIAALVLQGSQLQKVYDAKHELESRAWDLTGTGVLTHMCLLIYVIIFGSLKQLMVFPGLLCQNSCLMAGAVFFDFLNAILCITLHFKYELYTKGPALAGSKFGMLSASACIRLASIFAASK